MSRYVFKVLSSILLSVSMCVIIATDFNGLAALIFILPMILESLEETIKTKMLFEKTTDVIMLLLSSMIVIIIVLYMLNVSINEAVIKMGIVIYPFYEATQAIEAYLKKEESK